MKAPVFSLTGSSVANGLPIGRPDVFCRTTYFAGQLNSARQRGFEQMNQELIRIVDGIARDKNIERDQIYTDIEQAIASGLRKQFNTEDTSEFAVTLDRTNGDIKAFRT